MHLYDCQDDMKHGSTGRVGQAAPNGDFEVRCPACGRVDTWNINNLRDKYREAMLALNLPVAEQITAAIQQWGFSVAN